MKSGVISSAALKSSLYLLFICGWLLPKIKVGDLNLGFQELVAVVILLYKYSVDKSLFRIFSADLIFSLLLLLFGCFYLLVDSDLEGLLIGFRTILFVLASIGVTSFNYAHLQKLLRHVILVNFLFIFFSVIRILLNFYFNSFDLMNFFYGSDSYRVRAPFENGGASSQVPLGYMLAMLLSVPVLSKLKLITFMIGALGTTSRASLLSIVFTYMRRLKLNKFSSVFIILFLIVLTSALYMKSFSQREDELDGSANKRLELYSNSLNLLIQEPKSILLGFGISTKSLTSATGEGFYESFIINSLMQGGVLLFLASVWIILKTVYFDYKYKLFSISIAVLIGNLVGGSNYFSMFAYPLMVLIISLAYQKNRYEKLLDGVQ